MPLLELRPIAVPRHGEFVVPVLAPGLGLGSLPAAGHGVEVLVHEDGVALHAVQALPHHVPLVQEALVRDQQVEHAALLHHRGEVVVAEEDRQLALFQSCGELSQAVVGQLGKKMF